MAEIAFAAAGIFGLVSLLTTIGWVIAQSRNSDVVMQRDNWYRECQDQKRRCDSLDSDLRRRVIDLENAAKVTK